MQDVGKKCIRLICGVDKVVCKESIIGFSDPLTKAVWFEILQRFPKTIVRSYTRPIRLHAIVSVRETEPDCLHQVANQNARRARHAGVAVYEHAPAGCPRGIDELEASLEVHGQVDFGEVENLVVHAHEARVGGDDGVNDGADVENVGHAVSQK